MKYYLKTELKENIFLTNKDVDGFDFTNTKTRHFYKLSKSRLLLRIYNTWMKRSYGYIPQTHSKYKATIYNKK